MQGATRRPEGERGSAAAEFAASLPAVVLALAVCLGALQIGALQVRLQDAAADAARIVARGDSVAVAEQRAGGAVPGAALTFGGDGDGDLVCATLASEVPVAGLFSIPVSARSCALAGGQ
ncbi:MAG: TadE family type IV pilus minor pilin [Pseudoclavibacter sp.]